MNDKGPPSRMNTKSQASPSPSSLHKAMTAACEAALEAGRILRDRLGKVAVYEKAPADLVTEADLLSQAAIAAILKARFPRYQFLGEETEEGEPGPSERLAGVNAAGEPVWVVDPLDGTANFAHRLPGFSVSIALVQHGIPVVGVVYDPLQEVMYQAVMGSPPTKNGRPIRPSRCERLREAMVCCSFRPRVRRDDPEVHQFLRILEAAQTVRRLGSAALNLCYVAEGCLDAYWATSLKTWDVAAGYLLARTAGATICRVDGGEFDLWRPKLIACATTTLKDELLACLQDNSSNRQC